MGVGRGLRDKKGFLKDAGLARKDGGDLGCWRGSDGKCGETN